MSQFHPPPPPESGGAGGYAVQGPPPWSVAAISGFVLSLLGVTSPLGLVLGVVGILRTGGGRRRGLGLAVAAVPISLFTGALTVFAGMAFVMFHRLGQLPPKLTPALQVRAGELDSSTSALRALASAEFNRAVPDEALGAWLEGLREKHGTLVDLQLNKEAVMRNLPEGAMEFHFVARFSNGTAPVAVRVRADNIMSLKLYDIEVDGSSPRSPD